MATTGTRAAAASAAARRAARSRGAVEWRETSTHRRPGPKRPRRAIEQRGGELAVAAREGDEAAGVLLELVPACRSSLACGSLRGRCAPLLHGSSLGFASLRGRPARVGEGQQAREVAVALRRFDEQEQRAPGLERELRADERAQPRGPRGLVEARRAVEAAAIAEREGGVAELGRLQHQVLGVGGRLEEREGAAAAQLDVVPRQRVELREARSRPAPLDGRLRGQAIPRPLDSIFVFFSPSVKRGQGAAG